MNKASLIEIIASEDLNKKGLKFYTTFKINNNILEL